MSLISCLHDTFPFMLSIYACDFNNNLNKMHEMAQPNPPVPLSLRFLACFICLTAQIYARTISYSHPCDSSSQHTLTNTDPILTIIQTTTNPTTPSHSLHKRDFSGGGSAGVGIIVAVVLGVLGFLLLRWHRKRTQSQISKRDLTVRTRLNAWRNDATPQQASKRPPEYVEAVGWKSGQPTDMAREPTGGGGGARLTDSSMQELPVYGEVVGGGRGDVEEIGLLRPGEVHVR